MMKIIFGLSKIKRYRRPVVALGVFDGVHLGHIAILKATVRQAKRINGTSIAVTFWPHPQKEESLYSLEHRLRLIARLGIDACIVINFNRRFAGISPADFIRDILFKKIRADYIFVGKNFRFGRNAGGDFKTLRSLSGACHYRLKLFPVVKIRNKVISSTYIRKLIKRGDLDSAKRLLGRPVSVLGTVIKGKSLARKLGFSTANIDPHHEVVPPSGVYAVKSIFNKKRFFGVCNIGTKPTFNLGADMIINPRVDNHIEVHIFNFKQNIYGKDLEIYFLKKLRKERKFSSTPSLASQIKKDIFFAKRQLRLP